MHKKDPREEGDAGRGLNRTWSRWAVWRGRPKARLRKAEVGEKRTLHSPQPFLCVQLPTQTGFVEGLLCDRHCTNFWGHRDKEAKVLSSQGLVKSLGKN